LTSFVNAQNYAPLAVALVGLATLVGLWGLGTTLLWTIRLRLTSPWSCVTGTLLGIQVLSFIVQIPGMLASATRLTLSVIWIVLIVVGWAALLIRFTGKDWRPSVARGTASAAFTLVLVGMALTADLLVAMAPSTKIDELYYHMLVPSRIVSDGAIHFYREPLEAAIWPQMGYQIASAPIHAIGYPDATNVVSWGVSVLLIWFAWRVISTNTASAVWSSFWVAGLSVGMYPVVWHVTGGAHAVGDLAMAAAIVAFAERDRLLTAINPVAYAAMVSILLVSAATSKVTLLPACTVLFGLFAWHVLRFAPVQKGRQVVVAFALPWLILYCPILLWTWIHSGAPFGPMLADIFGSSVYSPGWIQQTFRGPREADQPTLFVTAYYTALDYSPVVWLGAVGAVFGTKLPRSTRAALALLFGLQSMLIYLLLPHDPRFLGGIHYGMVIVFASHPVRKLQNVVASTRLAPAAATMFLLPWLGIQLYYAKQFFPVALGFEKNAFYRRYIALYDDFVKLDKLLTPDTVLLEQGYRLSSVYAPRPIFFDPLDIPPKKKIAFLSVCQGAQPSPSVRGYSAGEVIYRNPHAVFETYRTPGLFPITKCIQVTQLRPE
jgi:hypothetical protein